MQDDDEREVALVTKLRLGMHVIKRCDEHFNDLTEQVTTRNIVDAILHKIHIFVNSTLSLLDIYGL